MFIIFARFVESFPFFFFWNTGRIHILWDLPVCSSHTVHKEMLSCSGNYTEPTIIGKSGILMVSQTSSACINAVFSEWDQMPTAGFIRLCIIPWSVTFNWQPNSPWYFFFPSSAAGKKKNPKKTTNSQPVEKRRSCLFQLSVLKN